MDNFKLKIITPERVFFEGEAYMVEFNTTEGEIGVYAHHIPLTCIVKPGILTIRMDGGDKEAALHSGFAEILPDKITILAEVIEWPEEIDRKRAEAAMERAKERIAHPPKDLDYLRAQTALMRAMARIALIK